MRIGINGSSLLANPDLGVIKADIGTAESEGFSSYWLAQTGLVDALGALAAAGPSTSAIELGTAVIPTWLQHPMALAGNALTTQAAVGGRLVVGIGLSHQPAVEGRLGMKWEKPVRHMLDYLEVLTPLLHGEAVSHRGEVWSLEGEMRRPTDQVPKVMLAALGEQMLRIAGKRTDGTILWCVGPETIRTHIAPHLNKAADEAGRPTPSIVCSIPCWVTDKPAEAREFIAGVLAGYASLPSYRAMLDIEGIHGLEDLSFVGSADDVRAGIASVAEAGATDFTAVIMGANPDELAATREVLGTLN
ncbi:MAG: TIGR03564 family F420-dependent LLM class oxidoreductase [Acidimicrobiales bacterium]